METNQLVINYRKWFRLWLVWMVFLVGVYLLQLLLDHPLLLGDVAELGGILLSKGSASFLGCSLFGRQRFLGLAVSGDLVLQEALLHLQELLRLPQPLLVLTPLRLVCRRRDSFDFKDVHHHIPQLFS